MLRRGVARCIASGGIFLCASLAPLSPVRADPPATSATPEPARAAPTEAPSAPVVTPPKLISEGTFPYPEGATGDATVVLTLTIDVDGAVRDATPNLENEPFSSRAAAGALDLRFEPAKRDGQPISVKILFEVTFHAPVIVETPAPEEPEMPPEYLDSGESAPPPPPAVPQEVTVRGTRPEPSRSVSLSRAEVRQIPGTFGDPFRAVEAMPGVTPIVSGLPFFFIRGAPPGDAGYFLDGIRVPVLFHVGIGPSVVHPALIDRVDLYPGGYPARFGRYSGGIVSGETVEPESRLHGEYNARLYDAGALVETPFADGRGTALVGGRYSYTGALLTLLASGVQLDYWDYQARASYQVSPGERVSVFAFGSYDYLAQITPTQTLTIFGAEFHRVDLRYEQRLGSDGQ
ncbi:MAG TPA: TonB-dependent receptor plug domain-containing protein, partial [Polyangiaceae bacterium]